MGARANCAGKLSDADGFPRFFEALECATELIIHERHFQPESRRLGMDAMAAPNLRSELVLAGLLGNNFSESLRVLNQNVRGLHHLDGESSVADVTAGEAKMEPAAGGVINAFSDVGGEGDDVMIESF